MLRAPDPYDPSLWSPFDHEAIYVEGAPIAGDAADIDTGLRCACGREVVSTLNDPDAPGFGWSHVGVGDASDRSGLEVYMPKLRAVV